jgi:LEA14-like dessication related protein
MGRFRSLFLGSRVRVAVTAVVALVLVVGVLIVVAIGAGVFGVPSVEGVDNRFGTVNDTATIIETNVSVDNPNPIGVQLGGLTLDYGVSMNGVGMANGTKEGVSLGSGASTVSLQPRMENERIPAWWVTHVRNGERTDLTVTADARSSLLGESFEAPEIDREISTDIDAALDSTETRPVDADRTLVSDPVLYINETSGSWGEVTDAETEIEMTFVVYNPKLYPVPLSELGYEMSMNDVDVGSGQSEGETVVPPESTATVTATTAIRNERLDEWWVSHLRRDQVTDLTIDFSARIDLTGGGGGAIRIPLDSVTHQFETDVFGTKNGTAPESGDPEE